MSFLCLIAAMSIAASAETTSPRLINSFEAAGDIAALRPHDARIQAVSEYAADGRRALRVEFQPADWPQVKMTAGQTPWDWRGFDALAIDITNPRGEAVEFGIRVDEAPQCDGVERYRQGQATIEPRRSATFAVMLGASADPMAYGMRGLPPVPGVRILAAQRTPGIDLARVVAWQVFLNHPKTQKTLVLDNVRLITCKPALEKIVDEFGQYTGADWPGKLKDVSEFATRRESEDAQLKSRSSLADHDRYGGWTKGPKRRATGFFRAEKIDGRWWLITPEGRLFLSFGMDCVNTNGATITTGREQMFARLPDKEDPLARYIGRVSRVHMGPVKEGATFDFLAANLERKFGRGFERPWLDEALARLPSWGFNTIGNWSDSRLYGNGRVPYVVTAGISGEHARISSGSDYWGRMHDPYDPRFADHVAAGLRAVATRAKADAWCLGYFVDNELSWGGFGDDKQRYGLAVGALAESGDSAAKQAFIAQLKAKYTDIARFNEAWATKLADWDDLKAPFVPASSFSAAMKADMGAFVKSLARQYFRTVREQLRQLDPNHLYLGCRFAWRTPEAVEAAAEFCDVVSFNIYRPRVDAKEWAFANDLNKPCIIGEFHFGSLDRGMFHTGLVAATDQQARAAMYKDYIRSVVDHPAFVGCHWFQYVDQPLTGRTYDGENYNIGFVTVTDTPYPEMVEAARAAHAEAYPRRWGH